MPGLGQTRVLEERRRWNACPEVRVHSAFDGWQVTPRAGQKTGWRSDLLRRQPPPTRIRGPTRRRFRDRRPEIRSPRPRTGRRGVGAVQPIGSHPAVARRPDLDGPDPLRPACLLVRLFEPRVRLGVQIGSCRRRTPPRPGRTWPASARLFACSPLRASITGLS